MNGQRISILRLRSLNKIPGATMARFAFAHLGYLDGRIHALVFTETAKGIRVISFRKANKREVLMYEQEAKS